MAEITINALCVKVSGCTGLEEGKEGSVENELKTMTLQPISSDLVTWWQHLN